MDINYRLFCALAALIFNAGLKQALWQTTKSILSKYKSALSMNKSIRSKNKLYFQFAKAYDQSKKMTLSKIQKYTFKIQHFQKTKVYFQSTKLYQVQKYFFKVQKYTFNLQSNHTVKVQKCPFKVESNFRNLRNGIPGPAPGTFLIHRGVHEIGLDMNITNAHNTTGGGRTPTPCKDLLCRGWAYHCLHIQSLEHQMADSRVLPCLVVSTTFPTLDSVSVVGLIAWLSSDVFQLFSHIFKFCSRRSRTLWALPSLP